MLRRMSEVESLTANYVFLLGGYRLFYLVNWGQRYFMGDHISYIQITGGIIQTVLYADFLYYYIINKLSKKGMTLPV